MTQESVEKKQTGFANLTKERRQEIGRMGGKAAHAKGRGRRFTREEASAAGKRAHELGRARTWTSEQAKEAGRKGGKAQRRAREEKGEESHAEQD